jgi:hypothetical protein
MARDFGVKNMKRNSMRHKARIFAVALPLFLLVTGCSTNKNTQNTQEELKTGGSAKQAADPPEISILTDPQQREYIRKNCTSDTLDYSTNHGNWRRAKDCNTKISETYPKLKISSLHVNSKGDITGIKLVTADGDTATELNGKYNTATEAPSGKSCVKFGAGIVPILLVVSSELCESLHYRQL